MRTHDQDAATAVIVIVAQAAVRVFNKEVDRIFWVMEDVGRSTAGWKALELVRRILFRV